MVAWPQVIPEYFSGSAPPSTNGFCERVTQRAGVRRSHRRGTGSRRRLQIPSVPRPPAHVGSIVGRPDFRDQHDGLFAPNRRAPGGRAPGTAPPRGRDVPEGDEVGLGSLSPQAHRLRVEVERLDVERQSSSALTPRRTELGGNSARSRRLQRVVAGIRSTWSRPPRLQARAGGRFRTLGRVQALRGFSDLAHRLRGIRRMPLSTRLAAIGEGRLADLREPKRGTLMSHTVKNRCVARAPRLRLHSANCTESIALKARRGLLGVGAPSEILLEGSSPGCLFPPRRCIRVAAIRRARDTSCTSASRRLMTWTRHRSGVTDRPYGSQRRTASRRSRCSGRSHRRALRKPCSASAHLEVADTRDDPGPGVSGFAGPGLVAASSSTGLRMRETPG